MNFDAPDWLWFAPVAVLFAWGLRWRGRDAMPGRRATAVVLKSLALCSLLLALANPTLPNSKTVREVILLQDRSASISATTKTQADADLRALRIRLESDGARVHLLRFGEGGDKVTELTHALHKAAALAPHQPGARILVVTDGNLADEDVAADFATKLGIPIDVATLSDNAEVALESVIVPNVVNATEPFDLTVRIAAAGSVRAKARLMASDGRALAQQPFETTGPSVVTFSDVQLPAGVQSYTVELVDTVPADRIENNRMSGTIPVRAQKRVLFVTAQPQDTAPVFAAVSLAQPDVELAERLPAVDQDLSEFEALVCDEDSLRRASEQQAAALTTYVSDGGGLLVLTGGDHGPIIGAVAELLPVQFPTSLVVTTELEAPEHAGPEPVRIPEAVIQKRHSVGLLLLIDTSSSMAEEQWVKRRKISMISMAKAAALAAADVLGDKDPVGVISFATDSEWILNFTPAGDKERIRTFVSRLYPRGGTNLYPALGMARDAFSRLNTHVKHVIVLSDGETTPQDFDRLVRQMAEEGITVSTVGIGRYHDANRMFKLAKFGRGQYTPVSDFTRIPQVVVDQAVLRIGEEEERDSKPANDFPTQPAEPGEKTPPQTEPTEPTDPPEPAELAQGEDAVFVMKTRMPNPFTQGIDDADWPGVTKFRRATARDMAWMPLVVDGDRPALSAWRYGLGRVTVWTPDTSMTSSPEWPRWEKFMRLWRQILRATARREVEWRPEMARGSEVATFVSAATEEQRFASSNMEVCRRIAHAGGGRMLDAPKTFEPTEAVDDTVRKSVRAYPLVAAILLIPAEIFNRRRSGHKKRGADHELA